MSILNLFWSLNIEDQTKYYIIIGFSICIFLLCLLGKKKKETFKGKSDESNNKMTKCQTNYMKCIRNNKKNNKDDFCMPCLKDGSSPDFFFDQKSNEWVQSNYH